MADFDQGLQGAVGGGASGFEIGGPVGGAIGAGVGLLSGLFGGNPEDERRKRFREFLDIVKDMRSKALQRTYQATSGLLERATGSAKRRAIAEGRPGEAESYILPAQQRIASTIPQAVEQTVAPFDQQELGAASSFADRPIQPPILDTLLTAGEHLGGFLQNNRYLDTLSQTPVVKGKTKASIDLGLGEEVPDGGFEENRVTTARRSRIPMLMDHYERT